MLTKYFAGLLSSFFVIVALSVSGCAPDSMHDDTMMKEDKMMKDDGMMKEDKMMKDDEMKDDKMMKDSM